MRALAAILALAGCLASASAQCAPNGRGLAATCATCHSLPAHDASAPAPLTAMSAGSIGQALRAFREGRRAGTVMPQLMRGYTDEEIDAIAAWLAVTRRAS